MIRGKDVVWVVWEGRGMKGRLKVSFQTTFWYLCSSWAKPTLRLLEVIMGWLGKVFVEICDEVDEIRKKVI